VDINIKTHDLSCPQKREIIKFMSVQPQLKSCNDKIELNEPANFVESILDEAKNKDVDLLIFPEYSISFNKHSLLQEWSEQNNCVVIAGTDIIENYNVSTTFYKGKKYETKKIHLSPLESPKGIKTGNTIYKFINSPIGSFVIIICNDINNSEIIEKIKNECSNIDFLIFIALQDRPDEHYAFINDFVLSLRDTKNPVYAIYCNSYQDAGKGGESAFFANEYDEVLKEAKKNNHIPNGSRLACLRFLQKNESKYYIAECKLDKVLTVRNPDPNRAKIKILFDNIINTVRIENVTYIVKNKPNNDTDIIKSDNTTPPVVIQELRKLVDEDIKDRSHDFDKFKTLEAQYSNLFSCFIECDIPDKDKINNIFEATYEIIIKENDENNAFPIKLTGNHGTGKSKFLSIFFIYLFNKIKKSNNYEYIPVYLDLHRYAKINEQDLQGNINNTFEIIFNVCKKFPDSYIILMIDSVEDHTQYKPSLLQLINNNLSKINNQKRLVCIGDLSPEDMANVPKPLKDKSDFEFRFTTIKPHNYKKVIEIYSKIYNINVKIFNKIFSENDEINEIDFCLLTFIRDYPHKQNHDFSLADVCWYYCKEKYNDDAIIFEKAEKAFKYFDNASRKNLNYDDWCFINKSIIFKNYLVAYYYSQCLKQECWNDNTIFKTSHGSGVTYFIKSIICTGDYSKEIEYFNIIKNLYNKFPELYSANRLLYFLMGRFKKNEIKNKAIAFLKEQKIIINELINNKDNNQENMFNELELLLRTIYISLIYLNQKNENEEYINLLLDDINKNEHNMKFHLQYYGDLNYDDVEIKTLDEENIKAFNQTFTVLERKLKQHLKNKKDQLFEVDLLTFCSIIQIRSREDPLPIENFFDRSKKIIDNILKSNKIENERLLVYLRMLKKDLEINGGFRSNYLFDWADKLNTIERTGWKEEGIQNSENVAEHTYSCWLIGFLYLPEKFPAKEEKYRDYSKSDILNMLLIHDLAKVDTGDIDKNKKTKVKIQEEDHIMRNFFMHDTYNLNICGASVKYTYYKKLWEDFLEKKNINGKIASDINEIQTRYKYKILKEKNNLTSEREKDWEQELEVTTDIGREILKILELH
jgi:5'-deoxynucleotidase YfbR-like HD superfamily hydrolase/predicted amidohydrolase